MSQDNKELYRVYQKGFEDGYHHAEQSHLAWIAHATGELVVSCYTPPSSDPQAREIYKEGFNAGVKAYHDQLKKK